MHAELPSAPNRRPWAPRLLCLAASTALLAGCVVAPRAGPHGGGYGGGYGGSRGAVAPMPPPVAANTTVYYYPERGQPVELQERDRYACYRWAVRESGVDPGMTPVREWRQVDAAPAPRGGAGPLVGAVAGAAIGAAVSSPRRAAEHAVIGAIFGAALGAAADQAQRDAARADQRRGGWVPVADPAQAHFRRAMAACMQGRGYRVN